jgi:hypothetical protein
MKYFKQYYFPFLYSIILYIEINNYYLLSKTSARKFHESNIFYFLLNNIEISKYISLSYYKNKKYLIQKLQIKNKIIERKKLIFIKETFYLSKGKIKIVGRGWKIIRYSYQLIIKLGYSHIIFLNLSPILKDKFKKKKKKYYIFYSEFYEHVNTLLNKLKLMRIPDTYTRKGIFHRKVIL